MDTQATEGARDALLGDIYKEPTSEFAETSSDNEGNEDGADLTEKYLSREPNAKESKEPGKDAEAKEGDDPWYMIEHKGEKLSLFDLLKDRQAKTIKGGKEITIPLTEMLSERAVYERFQHGSALRKAKELETQVSQVQSAIERGDFDALSKLTGKSVDLDKKISEEIERRIKIAEMTPEQRRIFELEEQQRTREAELEQQQAKESEERDNQMLSEAAKFAESAPSHFNIPITLRSSEYMMSYILDGIEEGVSPNEAATLAAYDYEAEFQEWFGKLSPEKQEALLGDKVAPISKRYADKLVQNRAKVRGTPVEQDTTASTRDPSHQRGTKEYWQHKLKKWGY